MCRLKHVGRLRRSIGVASLFLCLFAIGTGQLAAMPQEGGERVTTVDVGFDMGEPGLTVSLPIQLDAPDGIQVGTTVNEVAFPAQYLQFEEVRPGAFTEAEVTASLKQDEENEDNTIIQVTVTALPGKTLPNGVAAFMVFQIIAEAPGHQLLKLRNVARALDTSVPPSPIEPVTGRDGEIELLGSTPAVIICFFYLH